jgi:hypothetical protein
MNDIPMIFKEEMVKALRDGRKSVTRLIAKDNIPPCEVGDSIWVRETFAINDNNETIYAADLELFDKIYLKKASSSVMPKELSRMSLKVKSVKKEKLQEITEEQALMEGIEKIISKQDIHQFYHVYFPLGQKNGLRCCSSAIDSFKTLWEIFNTTWKENPDVWVIEFDVLNSNVEKFLIEGIAMS